MITFILLVTAMTIAVAAVVTVPLLRRGESNPRAIWMTLGVVVLLSAGGTSLYLKLSNWSWAKAQRSESGPRTVVSRLARKVWHHPNNLSGWIMLGRSYMAVQETHLAVRSYQRAYELTHGENVSVLLDLAEALSVQNEAELTGRAGELIERALVLQPHNPEALFFGAVAAAHRGRLHLARSRFTALLALNPPDAVKKLINEQIKAINASLATRGSSGTPEPAQSGAAQEAGQGSSVSPRTSKPAAAINITVSLSPKLRGASTPPGAPLYVFVSDPNRPGPPLAVKRLQTRFPQQVMLTSADAMIAGHGIMPGEKVEVVARISLSGSPIAKKGDPYGEIAYRVRRNGHVNVTIDRLTR